MTRFDIKLLALVLIAAFAIAWLTAPGNTDLSPKREADKGLGLELAHQNGMQVIFRRYLNLALQGELDAQNTVGIMYLTGEGTRKNKSKAIYWFAKAAKHGNVHSQNNLGLMYVTGTLVTLVKVTDDDEISLRLSCPESNPLSTKGLGVKRYGFSSRFTYVPYSRREEGADLIQKSAQHGNSTAQYNLGGMYRLGIGRPQNIKVSQKWYRRAYEQGYKVTHDKLGYDYKKGDP